MNGESPLRAHWKSWALLLGLGIAFYIAYLSTTPAEDAIILFDYSRNLATHGVITYGDGTSAPVEGATDFLYLILITLISKIGLSEFASSLILNYSGIFLICYLFWRVSASAVLPLIALVATPFLYATIMGFSAILFSSIYLLSLYLALRGDRRLYLAVLGLCLLRPDGVVWSAGLVATRLLATEKTHLALEFRHLVLWLIAPGLAYFAWRLWYFREWLPLPFIVKSTGDREFPVTVQYLIPILVPTAATIFCVKDKLSFARQILLLFAIPVIFYSNMRLEQNLGDRFLAPMFFGMLMFLVILNQRSVAILFLFLSVCLTWPLTSESFSEIHYSAVTSIRPIALELRKLPPGKLLSSEAGMLAYYSGWTADDSWGLNTPRYAHRLITETDVAQGAYDLIMAHCDINSLGTATRVESVTAAQTRTWMHHCEAIASFLRSSGYRIYLVPTSGDSVVDASFTGPLTTCIPQLIYAVSPAYAAAKQVEGILRSFGGSAYDRSAGIYLADNLCRINANANPLGANAR